MDIYEAIQKVSAGQTIYLLDGTYELSEMILIDSSNNGAENAYNQIRNTRPFLLIRVQL